MKLLLSSFFPIIPSPKTNSYFSPETSWTRYFLDTVVKPTILSIFSYSSDTSSPSDGLTLTTNVERSTPGFGRINFWSGCELSTVNVDFTNEPS